MKHSFRGLVTSALLIVACGSDLNEGPTSGPPEPIPRLETKPSQGGATGKSVGASTGTDGAADDSAGGAPKDRDDDGVGGAAKDRDGTGGVPKNTADGADGGVSDDLAESSTLELGWSPKSLAPIAWYLASSGDVDVSEGGVSKWSDRSGNGHHLTQSFGPARPALEVVGWNGNRPTVRFNGGQLLTGETWSGSPTGTNAGFTVLAVMRSAAPQDAGVTAWWSEKGDGVWAGVRSTSGLTLLDFMRLDDLTTAQIHAGDRDLGTGRHIVAWRFSPGTQTLKLTVDGATVTSPSQHPLGELEPTPLLVGATSPLSTGALRGDISELMIVGSDISDGNVQNFTKYARKLWGGLPSTSNGGLCVKADGQPTPVTLCCDDGNPDSIGDQCSLGSCAGVVARDVEEPSGENLFFVGCDSNGLSGWTPCELGPVAWYFADSQHVSAATDGTVSVWMDRSGHGHDVAQTANGYRPEFQPTGWNGNRPTLAFNGTTAFLRDNGWGSDAPNGHDAPFTVLAVVEPTAIQRGGIASWYGTFGGGWVSARLVTPDGTNLFGETRRQGVAGTLYFDNYTFTGSTHLGTSRRVLAYRFGNGKLKITVDGTTEAEQSAHEPLSEVMNTEFLIGREDTLFARDYAGKLSELVVVDQELSDAEIQTFREYAQAQWGGLTLCNPDCAGQPTGAGNGCGGICDGSGGSGWPCDNDTDCQSGLTCTPGAGPAYGGEPGTGACQPPECKVRTELDPSLCGTTQDKCGLCDVRPRPCSSASDCAAAESCTPGNGRFFGLGELSVCWPTICTTPARESQCGSIHAACGLCACIANCAGKTCGGDMSNGCGDQCTNVCADRQPGCTSDRQCAQGSVCVLGGGPRVGLAEGINVCLPRICTDHDLSRVPCGDPTSLCGTCPTCQPNCEGRCGGPDACGGTCTGTCAPDEECTDEGLCLGAVSTTGVTIPDGFGGTRTVPPLDPGPTSGVGATPGTFGVTDSGKATYRIPIAVPPARASLEPRLSLTYGGTNRNGVLGVGWSLEGLSSITRCRHTENRDGYSAPIADDRTDRYCIDGVQIVSFGEEEYGGDGTIHFPEFDTRTRVISYGVNPSGPDWFEVRRSNGLIYIYGRSERASVFSGTNVKREWALESVEDRVGNYMSISYQKYSGHINGGTTGSGQPIIVQTTEMVPTSISYGGFSGPGAPPSKLGRAITLTYENRPDQNVAFLAGHATWRTRRLKKIATKLGLGGTVRSYNITYGDEIGAPAANGASRIAEVEECGGDGVCLSPTKFEYFDDAITAFSPAESAGVKLKGEMWGTGSTLENVPGPLVRYRNGPVDDVFYGFHYNLTRDNCTAGAFLCGLVGEQETAQVPYSSWAFIRGGGPPPLRQEAMNYAKKVTQFVELCDAPPQWVARLWPIGDFDLDGRDDLIDLHVLGRSRHRWFPQGLSPTVLDLYPRFDTCGEQRIPGSTAIMDVTGDGHPDAVACKHDGLELHENAGGTTLLAPKPLPFTEGFCAVPFLDIDGDGTPNLRGGASVATGEGPLAPHKLVNAVLKYRADTGEGTWDPYAWPMNSCSETPSGTVCTSETPAAGVWVELNGDGLKDFVAIKTHFVPSTSGFPQRVDTTHAWLNTGRRFVEVGVSVDIKLKELQKALVTDLNHDGKEELVMPLVHEYAGSIANVPQNEWRVVGMQTTLVERGRFNTGVPLGEGLRIAGTDLTILTPRHDAVFADMNGDTADDLVMISGPSGNQQVFVLPGRVTRANLLSSVTDGLGKRIEVRWDPGNLAAPTYAPASDCASERCETKAVVVSEHSEWQVQRDGSAPRGERLFNYRYRDGRTSPADGKFLGFAERTIVERRGAGAAAGAFLRETLIQVENSAPFGRTYPLAGRRKLVRVTEPLVDSPIASGPLLASNRVTETEFHWLPQFGHGGLFATLETRTTRVSELVTSGPTQPVTRPILTIDEDLDTDFFGNVTEIERVESTPTTTLSRTTTDTTYRPFASANLSAWLIALPESRTVTDRISYPAPSRSAVRRTEFTYYPATNLLHHVTREPNDDNFYLDTEFVRFAADPYGNVEQIVQTTRGPEPERRNAITYNSDGTFPSTFTSAVGTDVEQTSYVAFDARYGTPILASDPNGIVTQRAFDSFGRVTRELSPATESQTTYTLDSPRASETLPTQGVMAVVTETAGFGRSEVGIDAFGRPVRQTETGLLGEDVLTETLYDDAGLVVGQSRPHAPGVTSQGFIQYDYDEASRLERIIQADSTTVEFAYASRAIVDNIAPELGALPENYLWFMRTKDPKGHFSLSIQDHRGEFAASRDTGGAWVLATPGPFETVTNVNVGNSTRSYEYDQYGRLTRSVDPDRGVERYTYTHYDELFEYFIVTNPSPELSYGYDQLGRIRTISSFNSGTATYNYDNDGTGAPNQIGRLVNTSSFDGSMRSFTYEPPDTTKNRGFVSSVTDTVDGQTMTTGFEYNDFGQVKRTRYPGASAPFVVDRRYDAGGNVQLIGSENFAETYWGLSSTHQGYLPANESYGGSNASDTTLYSHEYEALTGRVRRISSSSIGGTFQDVTHTYDDNGNLETRTDHLAPAPDVGFEQFAYDERDRLTDHFSGIGLLEHVDYTPDGSGNISRLSSLGDYGYQPVQNKPLNMPSSAGNILYGFDPRRTGNVTSRVNGTTQNFTYDSSGMPTNISIGSDQNAVRLKYHTGGDRSAKLLSDGRSVRYSGDYEREVTELGTTEHRYRIQTPFGPMGEIVRGDSGTELSRTYWHKDLLGSPEVLSQGGGALHRQKFSAFGRSDNPTWESTNPAVRRVRRGYTGHEHDPETGLVNMGARLYDNMTGRFMTPDPGVQLPGWTQSWNRFSYAWNNPMNWVDPTGLENATIENDPQGNQTITFTETEPVIGFPPDVGPVESPAPVTAPLANGAETPDVRTPATTPGASTGDEFLPAEWEDPPVPNQGFAPKVPIAVLTDPNFVVPDTHTTWEKSLQFTLTVVTLGEGAVAIGGAIKTFQFARVAATELSTLRLINPRTLLRPPGMSNAEFGKVIGWTRGGTLQRNLAQTQQLIKELPGRVGALREAGVTKQLAQQWADFYRAEAARVATNPNALPRSQLMQALADLL